MNSIQELFDYMQNNKDLISIKSSENLLTYEELVSQSKALANGLSKYIKKGDRVAVWVANSPKWIVINLALGLIGAIIVPLNMRYRSHELSYILKHSKTKMLIFQPILDRYNYKVILDDLLVKESKINKEEFPNLQFIVSVDHHASNIVNPYDKIEKFFDFDKTCFDLYFENKDPESIFYILYTSGTTSAPKGAMLSQRSVLLHSYNIGKFLGFNSQDTILGVLPFCGIFGLNTLYAALTNGSSIIPVERYRPDDVVSLIGRFGCTVFNGVDSMFEPFFEKSIDNYIFSSVRIGAVGIYSSESKKFIEKVEKIFSNMKVLHPYGMTEVGSMLMMGKPSESIEERSKSGGYVISPEIKVEIIDPVTEQRLPDGMEGEISVFGYNVTKGYLDDPQKTKESFSCDGKFKTGDLGICKNGKIWYIGRIKEALRLRGFLVSPKEIEDFISQIPEVEKVQVVGVRLNNNEVPIAFIKIKPGKSLNENDVKLFCQKELADYKCPARVLFVDEFPKTLGTNGEKIQKAKLKVLAEEIILKN